LRALQQVAENGVQRAPAVGIRTELSTVPNPFLSPSAKYQLITQAMGELEYKYKKYGDWIDAPAEEKFNPGAFDKKWNAKPENEMDKFLQNAANKTGLFAGMKGPDIDTLRIKPNIKVNPNKNDPRAYLDGATGQFYDRNWNKIPSQPQKASGAP
jgi:hypothetical protein